MSRASPVDLHFIDAFDESADSARTPLIVLHGLLGSADNWRSQLKKWQQTRRVLAVDLRNHGRSPHAEGMEYATLAGDVTALMERVGIERAHVLGHSMGGKVAISLARLAPQRTASLIVGDIAPVRYEHGHDDVFAALEAVREAKPTDRKSADALMAEHVSARPTRLFLATNLVRGDDKTMRLRVGLDEIRDGYASIIGLPAGDAPFDGPTLVLRGADSHYVSDEHLPELKKILPRARLVTLKNAGHWLHADQPEAFQEAVAAFIEAQEA
ncbi:alpha/beta fold hydrolase [Halomonas sp. HNIBRBA4712]|uniref:alpha/beta fold hydrolase n=1 Tax=Halomonas sp. HNIBRBA4712 TaxID=3373087 RepID=UPI0037450691